MDSNTFAKLFSEFLTDMSKIQDCSTKVATMAGFAHCLEEELQKVTLFQGALPFTTIVIDQGRLNFSILAKFLKGGKGNEIELPAAVEELLPRRSSDGDTLGKRKLSSEDDEGAKTSPILFDIDLSAKKPNDTFYSLNPNTIGAFCPFKKDESETDRDAPPVVQTELLDLNSAPPPSPPEPVCKGKHKLVWTASLHQKFVEVVESLGGPQHATATQINEHMKTEGLTTSQIASHLQKYRHLHRNITTGDHQEDMVDLSNRSPSLDHYLCEGLKGGKFTGGESLEEEDDDNE
ncbi:transcription factor HHO5-like [Andrographis paniculata]|uniref:transcription factor HHO5-like n=1 Tax=Andrographis paniculata TaxID=175694 RepID=UPI0021E99352|nr:transcription factor HHO5-like [Andrographis paniculata]